LIKQIKISLLLIIAFGIAVAFTFQTKSLINIAGTTITERIKEPDGYIRAVHQDNSFGYYLSNFPLKKHGEKVLLYDGNEKYRQDVHAAVLDIDVGTKDLQQCADAVMRLRAEYLYKQKRFNDISFNFTNGFKASYAKWIQGNRISVKGNKVTWYKGAEPGNNQKIFNAYLQTVFSYAGTLSLSKELKKKALKDLDVGDVFIIGGSPGHAVIVVDLATHLKTNAKIFCVAQSYMPAQSIHVLKNFNNSEISPWYHLKEGETLKTPEWDFQPGSLYSF